MDGTMAEVSIQTPMFNEDDVLEVRYQTDQGEIASEFYLGG